MRKLRGSSEALKRFLEEHAADTHPEEIAASDWADEHSVNCRLCGCLVDERDCLSPDDGEGDICPDCIAEAIKQGIVTAD